MERRGGIKGGRQGETRGGRLANKASTVVSREYNALIIVVFVVIAQKKYYKKNHIFWIAAG